MSEQDNGAMQKVSPRLPEAITYLYGKGFIRSLDYQFARFLNQPFQGENSVHDERVVLLATLVSYQLGKGNSCVNLAKLPFPLFDYLPVKSEEMNLDVDRQLQDLALLEVDELIKMLQNSSLVTLDETPAPLRLRSEEHTSELPHR